MRMNSHQSDAARAAPAPVDVTPTIDVPERVARFDQDAAGWQARFPAVGFTAGPLTLGALAGIALALAGLTRMDAHWYPTLLCAGAAACLLAMLHSATRVQTVRVADGWLTIRRTSLLTRRTAYLPLADIAGFSPAQVFTLRSAAGKTAHYSIKLETRGGIRRRVSPPLPKAEIAGAVAAKFTYALHCARKQQAGRPTVLHDPYARWRAIIWLVLVTALGAILYAMAPYR